MSKEKTGTEKQQAAVWRTAKQIDSLRDDSFLRHVSVNVSTRITNAERHAASRSRRNAAAAVGGCTASDGHGVVGESCRDSPNFRSLVGRT